jgi:hypothetical protein
MADQVLTFISSGAGTALIAFGAMRYLKKYLSSYINKKGENLATKEDIGAITREVERVRHDYNALLEEMKARHQLRLAAIDKRLQVHQEAFTNWRKLFTSNADDMEMVAQECRDWWNLNCLYLEPQVRQAYLDAVNQEHMRRKEKSVNALIANLDKMFAFPNLLFEAIQLPPLSENERKALNPAREATSESHGDGNK